ncbi:MAG: hypothetical protein H6713_25580 [Myxococcales bacterium]|nr:hypothetical protein [Myxococcales bacterium]
MTASSRLSRRTLGVAALAHAATWTLLSRAARADALTLELPARARVRELVRALDEPSTATRRGRLDPVVWQSRVEALLHAAARPLPELLAALELDRLLADLQAELRARGRATRRLRPGGDDLELKLFALAPGRAIVPHGHDNMQSAFLVLRGEARARHYDRLHDEPGYVVLRPTIDRALRPGESTSISDFRDNVHWFTAGDDGATLLNARADAGLSGRAPGRAPGRVYLDPETGERERELIRAPRVPLGRLRAKYDRG